MKVDPVWSLLFVTSCLVFVKRVVSVGTLNTLEPGEAV